MNRDNLWQLINKQDAGDIAIIATLLASDIETILTRHYPSHLLHLAAEVVGDDVELARRLISRAIAVRTYKVKQDRLREMMQWRIT